MKDNFLKLMKSLQFNKPTLVQEKTFEQFEKRKSGVFLSPTGTGKTHAYLIPLVSVIKRELKEVQAVVVVPTNELVNQVGEMLKPISEGITYKLLRASDDKRRLIRSFEHEQPQIVISTPGRLYDLVVNENALKVYTTEYLILDEADMLFDFDFMSQLDPVISSLKSFVYIFSATLSENINNWVRKYFPNVEIINLTKEVKLDIDHYILMAGMDKNFRLLSLLEAINPYLCIVFVSKNKDIDSIYNLISDKGYKVGKISSNLSLRERKDVISNAKLLKYQYIVASDLAARGLDIEGVSHIINYDFPYQTDFYIHRSGRTGRMGAHGEVYTFFEDRDSRKYQALEKRGINFKKVRVVNKQIVVHKTKHQRLTEEEIQAIRKVKKPTRVKPGYRKKNKRKIEKALKEVRRGRRRK